jgi:hypothetical protein
MSMSVATRERVDLALAVAKAKHIEMRARDRASGWIYFIGAPLWPMVKIGWALNPNLRLDAISLISPIPLYLLTGFAGKTTDEKAVHRKFSTLRRHGEWFSFEDPLVGFFDEILAQQGPRPWPTP